MPVTPTIHNEIIVYRHGWGLRLPERHELHLSDDRQLVSLAVFDRGSTHRVERIEETDDGSGFTLANWLEATDFTTRRRGIRFWEWTRSLSD
jgi:hypothetical protein